MKIVPYNVRKAQAMDGSTVYLPYMPDHPSIGCSASRTRRGAVEYIANRCGLSYDEFQRAQREGRLKLCPETRVSRVFNDQHHMS